MAYTEEGRRRRRSFTHPPTHPLGIDKQILFELWQRGPAGRLKRLMGLAEEEEGEGGKGMSGGEEEKDREGGGGHTEEKMKGGGGGGGGEGGGMKGEEEGERKEEAQQKMAMIKLKGLEGKKEALPTHPPTHPPNSLLTY